VPRVALGLEYDGTDFVGWQFQENGRSVQAVVEAAASRVADESVVVHGAGRTDRGVHATGQVAHFDTTAERRPEQWVKGINSNLPDDVSVSWVCRVPQEFEARRSAIGRRYRYLISQRRTRSPLLRRRAWWVADELDCAAITRAAAYLTGERDFSAFRAAGCQSRSPRRCVTTIAIGRSAGFVTIEVAANAFLYHMVRNLVGLFVEIGRGRLEPQRAGEILASRDRTLAPATAPPQGLTLVDIEYPAVFRLPGTQRHCH
jgi:tRNA pseudouridine38-40 synthase